MGRVDEGSVGVLRRPHDAPQAALPLHCKQLVPDLEPGCRVEAEVSVEGPAIEAPSDGRARRRLVSKGDRRLFCTALSLPPEVDTDQRRIPWRSECSCRTASIMPAFARPRL